MGEDLPLMPKRFCVEPNLLRTLAKFEFGLKSVKEVTEEQLEKYFNQVLRPTDRYIPDLPAIFRELNFDKSGDSRAKVMKFFRDADFLVQYHGLRQVPERVITKYFASKFNRRR